MKCDSLGIEWHYVARDQSVSYFWFFLGLLRTLIKIHPDAVFAHWLASTLALVSLKLVSIKRVFVLLREVQAHHLKKRSERLFLIIASIFFDRIVFLTEEARTQEVAPFV